MRDRERENRNRGKERDKERERDGGRESERESRGVLFNTSDALPSSNQKKETRSFEHVAGKFHSTHTPPSPTTITYSLHNRQYLFNFQLLPSSKKKKLKKAFAFFFFYRK
jgi:hypothetical protein